MSSPAKVAKTPLIEVIATPKLQKEAIFKPLPRRDEEDALDALLRPPKTALPPDIVRPQPAADLYPHEALRQLKHAWRRVAWMGGIGVQIRAELVEAVLPDALALMQDGQREALHHLSPRRMLAWLRPKIGQPLYTRADITRVCVLMNNELTRQNARRLMQTYGTAKVIRCAEWVATRTGLSNPVGYLITCLRADAMAQKWSLR